jgi:hypothetical protein
VVTQEDVTEPDRIAVPQNLVHLGRREAHDLPVGAIMEIALATIFDKRHVGLHDGEVSAGKRTGRFCMSALINYHLESRVSYLSHGTRHHLRDILQDRWARGEIDKEEFEERRNSERLVRQHG